MAALSTGLEQAIEPQATDAPSAEIAKNPTAAGPRKIIVGTTLQSFWGAYPGLDARLEQLATLVDETADAAREKYGRGPDLVALPEVAVTGERGGKAVDRSIPYEGKVQEVFAALARKHHCYLIVPLDLLADARTGLCYNACVVVDRKGETAGIYRKMFPAVQSGTDNMEGGMTPGPDAPIFQCDFGKLGVQICFDIEFDQGWEELARKGAELVVWTTQSPQTTHPAARALKYRYYIVSCNWRNNSTIFEPTGKIVAQIRPPQRVLVEEIDLSYVILPWSPQLRNGAALQEKYGDKVGFRYYEDEDCGLFWSNDSQVAIGEMVKSVNVRDWFEEHARLEKLFDEVRRNE
jgi:predicted amidohydrolase